MKKLMVAVAIVCAAAFAQAASFNWSSAENLAGDGSGDNIDDAGWTDAGITYFMTLGGETLSGTLETDFMGGALMELDSDLVVQTDPETVLDYSLYYTVTVDGVDYTSETITGQFAIPSQGDISLYTDGVSSWSSVPEPTSGLLLLLGVAGLALRRRRA